MNEERKIENVEGNKLAVTVSRVNKWFNLLLTSRTEDLGLRNKARLPRLLWCLLQRIKQEDLKFWLQH